MIINERRRHQNGKIPSPRWMTFPGLTWTDTQEGPPVSGAELAAAPPRAAHARFLAPRRAMLKVELHTHTSDDPRDFVPHSALDLIDRAANLGYHALAITLHDRQLDVRKLATYAKERGLLLIPGIERTIRGKHVLLINFPVEVEQARSFEDVATLKDRSGGLVIAPPPFLSSTLLLARSPG